MSYRKVVRREVGEMRVVGLASAGGSLFGSKRLLWGKVKVLERWDGQLLTTEKNCHSVAFHCSCKGHGMIANRRTKTQTIFNYIFTIEITTIIWCDL